MVNGIQRIQLRDPCYFVLLLAHCKLVQRYPFMAWLIWFEDLSAWLIWFENCNRFQSIYLSLSDSALSRQPSQFPFHFILSHLISLGDSATSRQLSPGFRLFHRISYSAAVTNGMVNKHWRTSFVSNGRAMTATLWAQPFTNFSLSLCYCISNSVICCPAQKFLSLTPLLTLLLM